MSNLFLDFSISEIHEKINKREICFSDIADATINSISKYEASTLAWVSYNLDKFKLKLKNLDNQKNSTISDRKLLGIPFGAKDIFNTMDFYTEMGTPIWKNFSPGNNARVIDSILSDGGLLVGKTVTAEFAVHGLNKTLNPHNPLFTPGTSSSGSAAAVSRGMVPFALASQTAGSITRPASFCGVWGMKPSFGLIPRTGSLKTTDSLDSIGFITSNGKNLKILLDSCRVTGTNYPFVNKNVDLRGDYPKNLKEPWRIGFIKTNIWDNAEEYVRNEVISFINKLKQDHNFDVTEVSWPNKFCEVHKYHETIYNKSLSYYFKNEKKLELNLLTPIMREMINKGESISLEELTSALNFQEEFCSKINDLFINYDFLISLATSGSAPLRNEKVKDDPSLFWTFGHLPTISAPQFRSPTGMPFAIQFISKKWDDYLLLQGIEELINRGLINGGSQKIE